MSQVKYQIGVWASALLFLGCNPQPRVQEPRHLTGVVRGADASLLRAAGRSQNIHLQCNTITNATIFGEVREAEDSKISLAFRYKDNSPVKMNEAVKCKLLVYVSTDDPKFRAVQWRSDDQGLAYVSDFEAVDKSQLDFSLTPWFESTEETIAKTPYGLSVEFPSQIIKQELADELFAALECEDRKSISTSKFDGKDDGKGYLASGVFEFSIEENKIQDLGSCTKLKVYVKTQSGDPKFENTSIEGTLPDISLGALQSPITLSEIKDTDKENKPHVKFVECVNQKNGKCLDKRGFKFLDTEPKRLLIEMSGLNLKEKTTQNVLLLSKKPLEKTGITTDEIHKDLQGKAELFHVVDVSEKDKILAGTFESARAQTTYTFGIIPQVKNLKTLDLKVLMTAGFKPLHFAKVHAHNIVELGKGDLLTNPMQSQGLTSLNWFAVYELAGSQDQLVNIIVMQTGFLAHRDTSKAAIDESTMFGYNIKEQKPYAYLNVSQDSGCNVDPAGSDFLLRINRFTAKKGFGQFGYTAFQNECQMTDQVWANLDSPYVLKRRFFASRWIPIP